MKTRLRAAVDPATLTVLGVLALGTFLWSPSSVPGRKHKYEAVFFWRKTPIEQVQAAQAKVDEAKAKAEKEEAEKKAKIEAEKDKQLGVAHDAAVGTNKAIDAAIDKAKTGTIPTKELGTAKQLSDTNVQAMDAAQGTIAPQRQRELEQIVADLNAGVKAGTIALDLMQQTLDKSVEREAKLKTQLAELETRNKQIIADNEQILLKAQAKEQDWALERDAVAKKFENYVFYAKLGIGALLAFWVASIALPMLSKVFPAVEGLSRFVGAIWSPGVQMAHSAADRLSTDLVAMQEWTKQKLAEKLTPEELAAYKKQVADEWMHAKDGSAAAVDRIKTKLRL